MLRLIISLFIMVPFLALAQEAPAESKSLADKILEILSSAEGASATIAVVVEFLLRLVPSDKPLSILHVIAGIVRIVADIADKVADILDKVIPVQNVKK